jgi:hypothetical protein
MGLEGKRRKNETGEGELTESTSLGSLLLWASES